MSRSAGADQPEAQVGRPRDPGVDRRIAEAAVALFGEQGWAGFSIEAVARRSGAGKASIYLRWKNKERLLVEALRTVIGDVAGVDTGTLRGDLAALARHQLALYIGPWGRAAMRVSVETPSLPLLAEHFDEFRRSQVLAARAIVHRGVRRGEVPETTPVTLLLDCLVGATMTHVQTTPPELRPGLPDQIDAYAAELVDYLLTAVIVSTNTRA
jgi:AcrR family transcriptional regulator